MGMKEKQSNRRERKIDRRLYKWTDRVRYTQRQIEYGPMNKQTNSLTYKQTRRQVDKQTSRQTNKPKKYR